MPLPQTQYDARDTILDSIVSLEFLNISYHVDISQSVSVSVGGVDDIKDNLVRIDVTSILGTRLLCPRGRMLDQVGTANEVSVLHTVIRDTRQTDR